MRGVPKRSPVKGIFHTVYLQRAGIYTNLEKAVLDVP